MLLNYLTYTILVILIKTFNFSAISYCLASHAVSYAVFYILYQQMKVIDMKIMMKKNII